MPYRVLVVSPDPPSSSDADDLTAAREEVRAVIRSLHPQHVLIGRVTLTDLMRTIQENTFDIIWFACHSDYQGLSLSDGHVSGNTLAQLLRGNPPSLIYLNSCDSDRTALDIHDATEITIICTVVDVEDEMAYVTGASLAHHLSENIGYRTAFELSRPGGDRVYRMIGNSNEDRIDLILKQLVEISGEVEKVRKSSERNTRRLDQLDKMLRPATSHRVMFAIGYWMLIFVLPFTFVEVRAGLGFESYAAMGTIFLVALMAYFPLSSSLRLELWKTS